MTTKTEKRCTNNFLPLFWTDKDDVMMLHWPLIQFSARKI